MRLLQYFKELAASDEGQDAIIMANSGVTLSFSSMLLVLFASAAGMLGEDPFVPLGLSFGILGFLALMLAVSVVRFIRLRWLMPNR